MFIFQSVSNQERTTLFVITSDGTRVAMRHRLNSRQQKAIARRYGRRVLKDGVNLLWRGSLIFVTSEKGFEMVGGGTLIDGIWFAYQTAPNNRRVQFVIQNGLDGCVELEKICPDWLTQWLVTEANK